MALENAHRKPALLGGDPAFKDPVYVTRSLAPDADLLGERLGSILSSRWFTNDGQTVQELEARLRDRLDVAFCAVFCNGTVALQVALRSLDISGEVITSPFTFPATVHAIEWNGLTPVFADVDPQTYNLDVDAAADRVTERTSALLPVHIFGNPCDVVAIDALAERRGLRVVYDAAQAFGVSHRGRAIGRFGDLAILSFHATKLFHTAEGGGVVGSDADHYQRLRLLRNFGIVDENEVRGVGTNGKLSEVHAALGLCLLDRAEDEIRARGRLVRRYRERLAGIDGIGFQRASPDTVANHAYFTIEIDPERFGVSRNLLQEALRAENVMARRYFSPLCSDNPSYRGLPSAAPDGLPVAHRLASRILCLPLYGELALDDVDRICDRITAIRHAAPRIAARSPAAP